MTAGRQSRTKKQTIRYKPDSWRTKTRRVKKAKTPRKTKKANAPWVLPPPRGIHATTVKRVDLVDPTPEQEEEPDSVLDTELPPPSSIATLFDETPTTLAKRIFPKDVLHKWKHSGTGRHSDGTQRLLKVRDIWDISSTSAQCNNTVGKSEGKTCWICGVGFEEKVFKRDAGLLPQCEHVLPIAQGVLFLSLYGQCDKERCETDEEYKRFLSMEYGWSHTVCNQEKTNTLLVRSIQEGKQVALDENAIRTLLTKIYTSTRKDSEVFKATLQKQYRTVENFTTKASEIVKVKLAPVVTYINERLRVAPSVVLLSAIAHAVGRIDNRLNNFLVKELKPPEGTVVETVYTNDLTEKEKNEEIMYDVQEGANALAGLKNLSYQSMRMSSMRHSDA